MYLSEPQKTSGLLICNNCHYLTFSYFNFLLRGQLNVLGNFPSPGMQRIQVIVKRCYIRCGRICVRHGDQQTNVCLSVRKFKTILSV